MTWWERVNAWRGEHLFGLDVMLTVATGVPAVALSVSTMGYGWWAFLLPTAMWAPLAWRRKSPVRSAAAVYLAGLVWLVLATNVALPTLVGILVSLYSVTVFGPVWARRSAMSATLLGSGIFALMLAWSVARTTGRTADAAFLLVVMVGFLWSCAISTWAFALTRRSRLETIATLRDRAERLEIERDQQATIAAAAERTRIAREMHDIVAHSLSVMVAQANGGRYAAAHDPDVAVRALTTISETGRAALADMRRLLGVLREPPGVATVTGASPAAPATGPAPSTPQPAEQDLEHLVDQMRASGMNASLVRMGTERRLPPGMGLAVYRICQESLTNILKHAGPSPTVTVLVQWLPAALVLEVSDDGRGASAAADSDGAGQGLLGMRERAAMFGGTVSSGPRPGGGFRVRAQLPVPTAAP